MENTARKSLSGARLVAARWFAPEALKGPGALGLAAAGHAALVANAQPQTLPALWELARLNALLAVICMAILGLLCFQASRLPRERLLSVRRMTIALIAGCLALIAGDALNLISADQQPWALIIVGATGLVLAGGLTSLIADARAFFDR